MVSKESWERLWTAFRTFMEKQKDKTTEIAGLPEWLDDVKDYHVRDCSGKLSVEDRVRLPEWLE